MPFLSSCSFALFKKSNLFFERLCSFCSIQKVRIALLLFLHSFDLCKRANYFFVLKKRGIRFFQKNNCLNPWIFLVRHIPQLSVLKNYTLITAKKFNNTVAKIAQFAALRVQQASEANNKSMAKRTTTGDSNKRRLLTATEGSYCVTAYKERHGGAQKGSFS